MPERSSDESVFRRVVSLAKDPSTNRVDPQRIQGALRIAVEVEQASAVDNKREPAFQFPSRKFGHDYHNF